MGPPLRRGRERHHQDAVAARTESDGDDSDAVVGDSVGRREPNVRWAFRRTFQPLSTLIGGCTSKKSSLFAGRAVAAKESSASRIESCVSSRRLMETQDREPSADAAKSGGKSEINQSDANQLPAHGCYLKIRECGPVVRVNFRWANVC